MMYLKNISLLAQELGRSIAFYDVETTTFRGKENFGITDIYVVIVPPEGPWMELGDLINPENAIDLQAQEITGITSKMVRDKKPWGSLYANTFKCFLENCWVAGFKNNSFDNHAVMDECRRYGVNVSSVERSIDVRKLYHQLMPTSSQKGTLLELSQRCKIAIPEKLHRSQPDVYLTIALLDFLISQFGVQSVAKAVKGDKLFTAKEIVRYTKARKHINILAIAKYFKMTSIFDVLREIGTAIDERLVDANVFAISKAQEALAPIIPKITKGASCVDLNEVKRLLKENHGVAVDLVQLRISLLNNKVTWPSLKP